jgi:hypothetical protein
MIKTNSHPLHIHNQLCTLNEHINKVKIKQTSATAEEERKEKKRRQHN